MLRKDAESRVNINKYRPHNYQRFYIDRKKSNRENIMPVRPEFRNLYPSDDQIENGLMVVLFVCGGKASALKARHTYEPLADYLNLGKQARDLSRSEYYTSDSSDSPAWHNKAQWARRQLKKVGFLKDTSYGVWQLSPEGVRKSERLLKQLKAPAIETLQQYCATPWRDPAAHL